MYNKEIVKSIRLRRETIDDIAFLKRNHIDWSKVVRNEIERILSEKVAELKKPKPKKETPWD